MFENLLKNISIYMTTYSFRTPGYVRAATFDIYVYHMTRFFFLVMP